MDNLASRAILLYGENSFERARELAELSKLAKKDGFGIEKIDGESLTSSDMVSLVSGISLLSAGQANAATATPLHAKRT